MKRIFFTLGIAVLATACQQENSLTGAYGQASLRGTVVMAGSLSDRSPAGVLVSVRGTGMSQTLDQDGMFEFIGVPEVVQLRLERNDGVNATFTVDPSITGPLVVELQSTIATQGRKRPSVSRQEQYEGTIKSITGTSLTLDDRRFGETRIHLTPQTVITKGSETLTAAALAVGTRIHIKASIVEGNLVATSVKIQSSDDDEDDQGKATANGNVVSTSAGTIVVNTSDGRIIKVIVDASTRIRQQGRDIAVTDIDVGDRIQAKGTRVDDTTIKAESINIEPGANNGDGSGDKDKGKDKDKDKDKGGKPKP